jgi:hypothetical protein
MRLTRGWLKLRKIRRRKLLYDKVSYRKRRPLIRAVLKFKTASILTSTIKKLWKEYRTPFPFWHIPNKSLKYNRRQQVKQRVK